MSNQASAEYCLRLQYNGNCMEAEQICPQLDVASTCANIRDQEPNTMSALPHPRSQVASAGTACIPPHLRTKAGSASVSAVSRQEVYNGTSTKASLPYNIGASAANSPLVTDGIVDDLVTERLQKMAMEREPTPPLSPKAIDAESKTGMEHLYLNGDQAVEKFKPLFIASLPRLPLDILSKIPSSPVNFAPEFLHNQLGGDLWSPGFAFIPPPQTSILPNRAYYTVDPVHDPHLPAKPGHHGAKLVPFFNINPEDNLDFGLPDDYDSSSEVPLFVLHNISNGSGKLRKRYVYYGHYAQSRWSDRLDYDRMKQCVPACVREYWAEELSASDRPGWVTEALRKHFFPIPDYTGTLPGYLEDEGGSVAEEDFANRDQKVTKDIARHVEKLRAWKKEADMRTSMIRKDFILAAFEKADGDEPKALRLWWEYLECVDYHVDFYHTLVTLQSRDASYA